MRGVTAIGTIVLARVLSPAEFGAYAFIVLVLLALSAVADVGIGPSLVQQEAEPARIELATAWTIQQAMWIVLVPGAWLLAPFAGQIVGSSDDGLMWQVRVASIALAFTMLRAVPSAMLIRTMRFGVIARIEISMHLVFYVSAVGLALGGAGTWSFVIALLLQSVAGAVLANFSWRRWAGVAVDRQTAVRFLRFGIPFQVTALPSILGDGVVAIFGSLAGGVAAVGQMQFSLRLSQLAASLDEIVGRVAFPAFSRLQGDLRAQAAVLRDTVMLTSTLVAGVQLWIIAVAPTLVPVVFGTHWIPAIVALQAFSLATLATVPAKICRSLILGQGRSDATMAASIGVLILLWVAFPILAAGLGVVGGGIAYVVAGAAGLGLNTWFLRGRASFPWAPLLRCYVSLLPGAVVASVVANGLGGPIGLLISLPMYGLASLTGLLISSRPDLDRAWRFLSPFGATKSARDGDGAVS